MRYLAPTDGTCHMSEQTVHAILQDHPGEHDPDLQRRHIRHDCECRIVEAPVREISEIVKNGGVPILNLEPTGTDKLGLVAKPFDGATMYVVIWHRPNDKFASARYQTITTCQLIRLADRLGALHLREGGVQICFWMQSLCIPYDSRGLEGEEGAKRQKDVYSKAYGLLIMDSGWLLRPTASETAYEHITHLKSEFPELTFARRVLLIGPSGFHIEEENQSADEHVKSDDMDPGKL